MKILLLEDNELFASSLKEYLELENFEVVIAKDGEEVFELTYTNNYDLYLFDINVPKINGLDSLRMLRGNNDNTPCIYLTSYKDKDTLKDGFKSGADDFMVKPFDEDELLLRINALLKRSNKATQNITVNGILFDINKNTFIKNNQVLNISKKVVDLFLLMYENKDKIITKDMIINRLWSASQEYSDGSIRVYISKLKDILGSNSIINIKGQGYKTNF
jgi:DNA-binding response OmpR family regulator